MRRPNILCGVFLMALGALSLVETLRLKDTWQGAKLMPGTMAVTLFALGVGHLAPSVLGPTAAQPPWPEAAVLRRVGVMFTVLALYVAAMPWAGFLPATALFVLVLLRALGAYSWTMTIALTAAIAFASHVVFIHWLGMPLPAGPLGL